MEFGATSPGDLYAGYVVEDSDLEYSGCSDDESSDDEHLARESGSEYHPRKASSRESLSSEDDFEKEMASEVLSALKVMVTPSSFPGRNGPDGTSGTPAVGGASTRPDEQEVTTAASPEYYDEVYFDSDSSDGGVVSKDSGAGRDADAESSEGESSCRRSGKKVRKLTNDELFYDPNMDDEDEKWVRHQRMSYHNVEVSRRLEQKRSGKKPPRDGHGRAAKQKDGKSHGEVEGVALPKSDAVLNCPACMVSLCLDCQRHELYKNQYRAMFVFNCRVLKDEVLKHIPKQKKNFRKRRRKAGRHGKKVGQDVDEEEEEDPEASYHPVRCTECNTEVAVVDSDEVFHFFNILASVPG